MSEENVDMVRRAAAFFAGLDPPGEPHQIADRIPDSVLWEFLDPEIEFLPLAQGALSGNAYRGYEGVRRFWVDFFSDWDEFRAEPQEFIDAGSQVAVVIRNRGRVHGLEVDEVWSHLWTLRNGKVLRIQSFSTPTGALEAAGPSE